VAVGVDVAVGSAEAVIVGPRVAVAVDVKRAPPVDCSVAGPAVGVGDAQDVAVGDAEDVAVAVGLAMGEAVAEGEGDGDDDGALVAGELTAPDSVADALGTGDAVGSSAPVEVGLAATVLVRSAPAMASVGSGDLPSPTTGPISKNNPARRSTATSPSPAMAQPGGRRPSVGANHGRPAGFFATLSVWPAL
jgi:hypothetical protein